jgi:type I restriction enzyme, S subunit
MAVKLGYKQTEVGVIPSDWAIQSLGNVADLKSGFAFPSKSYSAHGQFKIITISNVHDGSFESLSCNRIDSVPAAVQFHHILNVNDILISMTGYVGRACIVTDIYCLLNQRVGKLVPRNILHQFLYVLLRNPGFMSSMSASAKGAAQGNLSVSDVLDYRFPLPPLHEQRAIATALTDVDDLLTSLDRLIAKKRAIKQGVMHDLLTGRRRLPGFSGEWEVRRLGDLGFVYGGLTGKTKTDFGTGTAKYVPFLNVLTNVTVDLGSLDRVRLGPGESQNAVLKDDLLFNGSSETPEEVALCAYVPATVVDTYLNSFCFGFRLHNDALVHPSFLAYYFRSGQGRALVKSLAQGSTRYNISKVALLSTPLPLPPLPEQRAIAAVLTDLDDEIDALQARRDKTHAIKQAMMHELLTGRTRLV